MLRATNSSSSLILTSPFVSFQQDYLISAIVQVGEKEHNLEFSSVDQVERIYLGGDSFDKDEQSLQNHIGEAWPNANVLQQPDKCDQSKHMSTMFPLGHPSQTCTPHTHIWPLIITPTEDEAGCLVLCNRGPSELTIF